MEYISKVVTGLIVVNWCYCWDLKVSAAAWSMRRHCIQWVVKWAVTESWVCRYRRTVIYWGSWELVSST